MLLILDIHVIWVFFIHIEVKDIIFIIMVEVINQGLVKNYSIKGIPRLEIPLSVVLVH